MPTIIGSDNNHVVVLADNRRSTVVAAKNPNGVVVLADNRRSTAVAAKNPNRVVVLSGIQGPPGIGGGGGGQAILVHATIDLGGHRVVTPDGRYADNTDIATMGMAIGVTNGAVGIGNDATVTTNGELAGFSNLTTGRTYYLSISGQLSTDPQMVGYSQEMGVATSTTAMIVNIQPALEL